MKYLRHVAFFAATLLNVFCAVSPAFSGELSPSIKPRIAVFGFLNLTGDDSFTIPTETATENLSFSLRLLNQYETVETDMILRDRTDARLARYCAAEGLNFILYGTLTQDSEGKQTYELALFDRQNGSTTVRKSETGESVMDVFEIADRLSASVLGSLAGRKITFGSVRFVNGGKPAAFDAFIDGVPVRSGEGTIDHVPDGAHVLRLVRTDAVPPGTPPTLDFTVTVAENAESTVSFAFEPLTATVASQNPPESSSEDMTGAKSESLPDSAQNSRVRDSMKRAFTRFFFSPYAFVERSLGDYDTLFDYFGGGGVAAGYASSRFGLSLSWQTNKSSDPTDTVNHDSMNAFLAGAFYRVWLADGAFEIRPEIAGGAWSCSVLFKDRAGGGSVSGLDPAVQASVSCIAYRGSVGFSVTPLVTYLPATDVIRFAAGVRCGVSFGGHP